MLNMLAQTALVFLQGTPPEAETGTLLVWTGGCDAVLVRRVRGRLLLWDGKVLDPASIDYWMRLPHPTIWPTAPAPDELVPMEWLYSSAWEDALEQAFGKVVPGLEVPKAG